MFTTYTGHNFYEPADLVQFDARVILNISGPIFLSQERENTIVLNFWINDRKEAIDNSIYISGGEKELNKIKTGTKDQMILCIDQHKLSILNTDKSRNLYEHLGIEYTLEQLYNTWLKSNSDEDIDRGQVIDLYNAKYDDHNIIFNIDTNMILYIPISYRDRYDDNIHRLIWNIDKGDKDTIYKCGLSSNGIRVSFISNVGNQYCLDLYRRI